MQVAYKNVIGARRAAWRVLSSIEAKEQEKGDNMKAGMVADYRKKVEAELGSICKDILKVVTDNLLPSSENAESRVFYHKMAGDYYRYLAEVNVGKGEGGSSAAADQAMASYKAANEIANKGMEPTHPIRLGLALNFSVFYYEIMLQPDKACSLAKQAFDDAIAKLDSLDEESYKDATLIMQLLRDNLTLWTSQEDDNGEGDDTRVDDS